MLKQELSHKWGNPSKAFSNNLSPQYLCGVSNGTLIHRWEIRHRVVKKLIQANN